MDFEEVFALDIDKDETPIEIPTKTTKPKPISHATKKVAPKQKGKQVLPVKKIHRPNHFTRMSVDDMGELSEEEEDAGSYDIDPEATEDLFQDVPKLSKAEEKAREEKIAAARQKHLREVEVQRAESPTKLAKKEEEKQKALEPLVVEKFDVLPKASSISTLQVQQNGKTKHTNQNGITTKTSTTLTNGITTKASTTTLPTQSEVTKKASPEKKKKIDEEDESDPIETEISPSKKINTTVSPPKQIPLRRIDKQISGKKLFQPEQETTANVKIPKSKPKDIRRDDSDDGVWIIPQSTKHGKKPKKKKKGPLPQQPEKEKDIDGKKKKKKKKQKEKKKMRINNHKSKLRNQNKQQR